MRIKEIQNKSISDSRHHLKFPTVICLKCKCALMVFTLSIATLSSIQAQSKNQLLDSYFFEVRTNKNPSIPKSFTLPENAKTILSSIAPYLHDTVPNVRAKAYTIIQAVGQASKIPAIRQGSVIKLIEGGNDKNSGNVGEASDYLTTFLKIDFTTTAKDSIKNLFRHKIAHLDQLLRLIGFLELVDMKEEIRPLTQAGNPQGIRWAAIVSLARMNDPDAAFEMMRRVKKLPVSDEIIYKLFPDLAYSRSSEAVAYMVEVMRSDEKKCFTADAERQQPIPCGYRIMEQLAPVIEGYPLQLDESGDVKTKDYVGALKTVRDWFDQHPGYSIRRDNF